MTFFTLLKPLIKRKQVELRQNMDQQGKAATFDLIFRSLKDFLSLNFYMKEFYKIP